MKSIYTIFFALVFLVLGTNLSAQNGCDGARYIDDLFEDITKTTIQYGQNVNGSGNDQNLMMDIYYPENDDSEIMRPVLILAHGGSFIGGSRQLEDSRCRDFAKKGYVTATIDYRLWSFVGQGFPDSLGILDVVVKAVGDMKAAIRYFRHDADMNGNTYNIDPNLIFVGGYSAGAVAAIHTGMLQMDDTDIPSYVTDLVDANGGIEGTSGNGGYSTEVAGILNLSGGLYRPDWVDPNDPPMVSYHGTADGTVPYGFGVAASIMTINGSGNIHPAMQSAGIYNHLFTVEGGDHGDIYPGGNNADTWPIFLNTSAEFLEVIICETVGTDDLSAENMIKLYPNPARETATLEFEKSDNLTIVVYNQLGQQLKTWHNFNTNQLVLDKATFGSGLFFINVRNSDKQYTTQLVFE